MFALNGDKLFTPGSTTKLLTEGTALHLLGPDYRFHTFIYRTGEIDGKGKLKGDLVLVASGDPNLSNRMQPDGTLAFADEDHSYGGPDSRLIPGDPLIAMQEFAQADCGCGIKRVEGRVIVDVSLFPEGDRELGTGVVISPIAVNDNVIDVTIEPGPSRRRTGQAHLFAAGTVHPFRKQDCHCGRQQDLTGGSADDRECGWYGDRGAEWIHRTDK